MKSGIFKIILPIVILVVAVAVMAFMMKNRIEPDRMPAEEQVMPVEVELLEYTTAAVEVAGQGTVVPARQVHVRSEVTGKVVEISKQLVPGGIFRRGQTMARIDTRDYEIRVAAQRDALARATLNLKQERARQSVAGQEWELLEGSIPADKENRELALRIPQIESAEAALAAAEGALAKAELDLERCRLTAPFNSVVIGENVDPGQVVNPQTEVATLVGTDQFWIQVSVPVEYLTWIRIPEAGGGEGSSARIIQQTGAAEHSWEGSVVRLLGDLDQAGRQARLLVSIDDPLNMKKSDDGSPLPLLIGSYVTVEILGAALDDVMVIPRSALRDVNGEGGGSDRITEGIWIMDDDDRLRMREVLVAWRTRDAVFVNNGIERGLRLVTSSIPTPIEGMKLSVIAADDSSGR